MREVLRRGKKGICLPWKGEALRGFGRPTGRACRRRSVTKSKRKSLWEADFASPACAEGTQRSNIT